MAQSIKIFVALGTQRFPFNRLIEAINSMIDNDAYAPEEILVQSSIYDIKPKCASVGMISVDEFDRYMREAEVIITHSGVNSIISCMRLHKPFIIAPRLKKYSEHIDNHQIEIAQLMKDRFNAIILEDYSDLTSIIDDAKRKDYKPWVSMRMPMIEALSNTLSTLLD